VEIFLNNRKNILIKLKIRKGRKNSKLSKNPSNYLRWGWVEVTYPRTALGRSHQMASTGGYQLTGVPKDENLGTDKRSGVYLGFQPV